MTGKMGWGYDPTILEAAVKKHKTELRDSTFKRSYCMQEGCEFYGLPAAQGICGEGRINTVQQKYLESVSKHGEKFLAEMKALRGVNKMKSTKKWVEHLELQVLTEWINHWFTLDELVSLRAENARLRLKLGKYEAH
jgi:hypothetical protein